jgi:hypothetical protein
MRVNEGRHDDPLAEVENCPSDGQFWIHEATLANCDSPMFGGAARHCRIEDPAYDGVIRQWHCHVKDF